MVAPTYGTRAMDVVQRIAAEPALGARLVPGRPEVLAQVDFGVDRELARTVTDILVRRTQLYYRDVDQGLTAAPIVAARMAGELGWSEERTAKEVADYAAEVARSRRWREG